VQPWKISGLTTFTYVVADELLFPQLRLTRYLLNRAGLFHAGGYPLHGLDFVQLVYDSFAWRTHASYLSKL
jgi:hypothetical protein